MKRFMMFCSGLLLSFSLTGCCLLGHGCGGGACGPCGGGYGAAYPYSSGGGCPGGACGAAASGYPSAFNSGAAYSQAAMAPLPGTQTALVEPIPTF